MERVGDLAEKAREDLSRRIGTPSPRPEPGEPTAEELGRRTAEWVARRAKVPERYASKVRPNHAYDELLEGGRGLLVTGPVGTGKTHLAWSVLLGYAESHTSPVLDGGRVCEGLYVMHRTVRFVVAADLYAELKSTYDGDGSEMDVIRRYAKCDLLVLDDLGKGLSTEWALSRLYQIVNSRYNDCLPTVVTTQHLPDELGKRLSKRAGTDDALAIVSRLCEMCRQLTLDGPDRRIRGAGGPA